MSRSHPQASSLPIEVEIADVAFGGAGVGRVGGKAVFVPFTIPGENVRAHVRRNRTKYVEADLDEVLVPSADRVLPVCPVFGICGGCKYQHIAYERQLEIKRNQVAQVLRRLGKLTDPPVLEMVPSPQPLGYRNRITVHRDGGTTGFYDVTGRRLVDVERCPIASDKVNGMLSRLRQTRVEDGNYCLSEPTATGGFHQTNTAAARRLLEIVESLCPDHGQRLIDAYCGSGFFSRRLVNRFDEVVGIEWSETSIAAARKKAAVNEKYVQGDVGAILGNVLASGSSPGTMVILDPPARGLDKPVVSALLDHAPQRILYVSCDPSTLARDLSRLSEKYHVDSATPLDMFPQTAEIEVVTALSVKE